MCKSDEEIKNFVDRLQIKMFSITQKIDFDTYGKKPVYSKIKKEVELYLKTSSQYKVMMNIRENNIETEDSFLSLGFNDEKQYTFYDINEKRITEKPYTESIYFSAEIFMDETLIYHSRSVYGLLDLFGDIGGVLQFLQIISAFFIIPYNESAFIFRFIKYHTKQNYKVHEKFGVRILNFF